MDTSTYWDIVNGIIAGIVGGLVVLLIQNRISSAKEKKERRIENTVGIDSKYILHEDFFKTYIPDGILFGKIVEEFGQPLSSTEESFEEFEIEYTAIVHKYKFKNATVLFSTLKNDSSIVAVTVCPRHPEYNIFAPMMDQNQEPYIGKATINFSIVRYCLNTWSEMFIDWGYSAIQSAEFTRGRKGLKFTFFTYDFVEENPNKKDFLSKTIEQVCVSNFQNFHPFVYYYET